LRYNDPSGHRACGDGEDIDCGGHKQDPLQNPHPPKPKRKTLNIHDTTEKGYFQSWEGEQNIDPGDWQDLLADIRDDVHSTWGTFLPIEATYYDTPFYNDHGNLSGRGCLGEKCYDRSELNYVAQGELWAAVGVSNQTGHAIVKFWKESKCLWMCERNDLQEEKEIFDIGYHDYQEHYPPHPISPYDVIPGIIVPLAPMGPGV